MATGSTGTKVKVAASGIEGGQEPTQTIRKNSRAQGKKSAGNVGSSNVNHA